jgi:hypothetical protein
MDNFSIPSQRLIDSFGGYDSDYTVYSGNSSEDWRRILNVNMESPPENNLDFETIPEDDPNYSPTPSPPPQIPAS